MARGPPACFGQPRAASAHTAALTSNLSCYCRPSNLDSTSSLAAVIIDCLDFLQHGGRARPHSAGRCRPRTHSTAYKQVCLSSHKLRGPRCLSSHNRTNRQFLARSSPLQAVSPEKDSAGQSFVARGPPACFGASARTAALASNLSCDSRPSNVDSTSSLAAVIIDCIDFLQHGRRARPHLVGRCRPRTRSTAYKQLCLSSHKLRGPRCLSSHNRTNRQFLARGSPLQAVSPEKDCAGQSFVARGPPVRFGQPRAASAKLAPIQAASQDSRAKLSHKH